MENMRRWLQQRVGWKIVGHHCRHKDTRTTPPAPLRQRIVTAALRPRLPCWLTRFSLHFCISPSQKLCHLVQFHHLAPFSDILPHPHQRTTPPVLSQLDREHSYPHQVASRPIDDGLLMRRRIQPPATSRLIRTTLHYSRIHRTRPSRLTAQPVLRHVFIVRLPVRWPSRSIAGQHGARKPGEPSIRSSA